MILKRGDQTDTIGRRKVKNRYPSYYKTEGELVKNNLPVRDTTFSMLYVKL